VVVHLWWATQWPTLHRPTPPHRSQTL